MKVQCPQPDCRHEFQVIDVDGVMSERRLMQEVTQANHETEEMIDRCQMLQGARDSFDRGMEEARAIATKYRDQFAPSDALPWDSKEPAPHCWQTCQEEDCDECTALLHDGIIMGCDNCDLRGLTSADHHSWRIMPDGLVFCISCAERTEDIN